jgi:Obg family GTPase CgtA-like protein
VCVQGLGDATQPLRVGGRAQGHAELVGEVRGQVERAVVEQRDAPIVLRPLRARDDVVVTPDASGAYRVTSDRVERWVSMLPSENREAMRYLEGRLRRAGVEKALIKAGARVGDDVVVDDLVFEFRPDPEQLPPDEREAALAAERAAEAEARGETGEVEDDDWSGWDDGWEELDGDDDL